MDSIEDDRLATAEFSRLIEDGTLFKGDGRAFFVGWRACRDHTTTTTNPKETLNV